MYRKKPSGRLLLVIAGLIQLMLGILLIVNPLPTLRSIITCIGFIVFFSGIVYIFSFSENRQGYFRPGWILCQGICDLLLGLLLIFNSNMQENNLPIILGLWALFTGATQLSSSLQIKALEFKKWWWIFVSSIINIAIGLFVYSYPMVNESANLLPIAIFAVLLGFSSVAENFVYKS